MSEVGALQLEVVVVVVVFGVRFVPVHLVAARQRGLL